MTDPIDPAINEDGYHLFTPRQKEGTRLRMYVTENDSNKVTRGPGFKGTVRDVYTGEEFNIWGAACTQTNADGSGCFCDAIAERVESNA